MSTHQPTVFNQIFSLIKYQLLPLIGQLDKLWRVFNSQSLFKVLLYAQCTWKESLRDIETSLQVHESKLYHAWLKSFARSTISYWNNKVQSGLYEKLFYVLLDKYKQAFVWKSVDLWITTVALDWSIISLALNTFDRARHRSTKWGIRLHTGIDISNAMPRFIYITDAKTAENKIAKQAIENWNLKSWEMIVFDRYYVDFKLWKSIDAYGSFFVTRTKHNTDFVVIKQNTIQWTSITMDAEVELMWNQWQKYGKRLRVVRFYDTKGDKDFEYITNNFELSAEQIANIYRYRWEIEVFFRWIKQNLKIKTFLGTSENAVKNQIWIAMIYYLLVRYMAESAKLWVNQLLKLTRIISEKCFSPLVLSELRVLCRSKHSRCLSENSPPIGGLFSWN